MYIRHTAPYLQNPGAVTICASVGPSGPVEVTGDESEIGDAPLLGIGCFAPRRQPMFFSMLFTPDDVPIRLLEELTSP